MCIFKIRRAHLKHEIENILINIPASIIILSDNRIMSLEIISETFKFVWPIYGPFIDYLIETGNRAINNKKNL